MRRSWISLLLVVFSFFWMGFSLENAIVPKTEILSGGPPKDGIPALMAPNWVDAQKADFMNPGDKIIGVVLAGQPRAYPIKILNWHEVVNDVVGDNPIAVTF